MPRPIIIDAHQDIAWNAHALGRDWRRSVAERRPEEAGGRAQSENGTLTCSLPDALAGNVGLIFATLYASPAWANMIQDEAGYNTPDEAHALGQAQLSIYRDYLASASHLRLVGNRAELDALRATWGGDDHQLGLVILMEGADPIRTPAELPLWVEAGVRIIGLAWSETRYSGGTTMNGHGPGRVTALGHELLKGMAEHKVICDCSHLAPEAFDEVVASYEGVLIASHTNPRHFCDTDRHLSDAQIRALAAREGVMGLVLYNAFMHHSREVAAVRANTPMSRVVAMVDYVCQLTGSARHVAIGTDWDGGFGLDRIPLGFDSIADLGKLGDALADAGYGDADIAAIMGGNWQGRLEAAWA